MTFLLAAMTSIAATATEANDTIADVASPNQVVVTENDHLIQVQIKGSATSKDYEFKYTKTLTNNDITFINEHSGAWDFSLPFKKKKKSRSHRHEIRSGSIHFGFVTALKAPDYMDIDMASSYEIGADILSLHTLSRTHRSDFSIGFGINWRNYRMTGHSRFVKDNNGFIVTDSYPEGADIHFSRIKIFSLTFPLTYSYDLTKNFSIDLGAILNVNTYASIKTRYKLDGQKIKDMDKHIHQKPVTVDLTAGFGWQGLGVYVKYSPCNMLNTNFGPSFKSLSAGIKLNL